VAADPGNQVNIHSDSIPAERVLPYGRRRDVLHPMRQPPLDGPWAARSGKSPGVAILFEFADLGQDARLGLATYVSSVRGAVITNAHRDPSMPASVSALVDASGAVGRTSAFWPGLARHLIS